MANLLHKQVVFFLMTSKFSSDCGFCLHPILFSCQISKFHLVWRSDGGQRDYGEGFL